MRFSLFWLSFHKNWKSRKCLVKFYLFIIFPLYSSFFLSIFENNKDERKCGKTKHIKWMKRSCWLLYFIQYWTKKYNWNNFISVFLLLFRFSLLITIFSLLIVLFITVLLFYDITALYAIFGNDASLSSLALNSAAPSIWLK